MVGLSYRTIGKTLRHFGQDRTLEVGAAAAWHNDALGQADWLTLLMRETLCQNIESRGKDKAGKPSDTGVAQINRYFNDDALKLMNAVKAGTWGPRVRGVSPFREGYCPTLDESLAWLDRRFTNVQRQAAADGVKAVDMKHFTFSSHNAGYSGALKGYRKGNSDLHTTGGEYGTWCVATSKRVKRWLRLHPSWKP